MAVIPASRSGYGSDTDGLVWGYRFAPDTPPAAIDCAAADEWLRRPPVAGEFIWLHFSLSNATTERWMHEKLELSESFYEALHESVASTHLELEDDALITVIHDAQINTTFDAGSISTATIWIGPRLVVSARLRPLRSIDRLRAAVRTGQPPASPEELLSLLLLEQAAVLADIVRESTIHVNEVEDMILEERVSISRAELAAQRRSLVRLQRLLAPEPAALFRLLNRPPPWFNQAAVGDLRQAAEEFSAAVSDSTALTERLKLLQEELAAMVSEHTSRTLFILTLVTVLALPINLVAGLFGMNVGGIPLAQDGHGFALVLGILTLVTIGLAWVMFARLRD